MPVFLATDVLLWLLVAAATAYFLYCRRRAHLAAPWRRVLQSRAALASLVVLALFALVGLLDSLHFRPRIAGTEAYSNEALSVLDLGLQLRGLPPQLPAEEQPGQEHHQADDAPLGEGPDLVA